MFLLQRSTNNTDPLYVKKTDTSQNTITKVCTFTFPLYNVKNWSKNREPDETRIQALVDYYNTSDRDLIPGIIYGWKRPGCSDMYIFDGIHRIIAAYKIKTRLYFFLHVIETMDEQIIIDEFININKSINVPSIFLDNTNMCKKIMCQNIVNELSKRYPTFLSPSRKPFVYNFNRDNLIEFISSLEIDFTDRNIDTKVVNELIGLNHVAWDFVLKHKIKCPNKCNYHKFWLFYLDKSFIKSSIEEALNPRVYP